MMDVAFIPASDLKRKYNVFVHFYSLEVPGIETLKCRSVLEITFKAAVTTEGKPTADAVFVMMNPGSSRPIVETDHVVSSDGISVMTAGLVPTVPDTTQYQVMRIMHYMGWQHARVINLSDLRDPKSGSFSQRYVQLESESGSKAHSVFSSQRSAELKQHLSRKPQGPIVCAWGVSDALNPLIERASAVLSFETAAIGLLKSGHPGKYFHPLPSLQSQKEQWVAQMLELLHAQLSR